MPAVQEEPILANLFTVSWMIPEGWILVTHRKHLPQVKEEEEEEGVVIKMQQGGVNIRGEDKTLIML